MIFVSLLSIWYQVSNRFFSAPRASTFVGSAAYVSPELLAGAVKTTSQRFIKILIPSVLIPNDEHSSDVWALGCIIYFLLVGKSPFMAMTEYLTFKKIEALDYSYPDGFDSEAQDIVNKILVNSASVMEIRLFNRLLPL